MKKIFVMISMLVVGTITSYAGPDIAGYMYMHVFDDSTQNAEITSARLRMWAEDQTFDNLSMGILVEADARRRGNELNQLYWYAKQGSGVARVGRIFTSAGFAGPAPQFSPTARYPQCPFTYAVYAYGVQGQLTGDKYFLMHDITGTSGKAYDSSQAFSRIEYSYRTGRKFKNGHIAQAGQLSEDFIRLSVDGCYKIGDVDLFGAVYYSDEETRNRSFSALSYATYNLHKWVKPHVQVDARQDGDTVTTVGTMLGNIMHLSFFADYEFGGPKDGFVGRVQLRHDF